MGRRPGVWWTSFADPWPDTVLRSLLQYSRLFTLSLGRTGARRMLAAHARGPRPVSATVEHIDAGLKAAAGYFRAAQDHGADAGMGSYHLINGWGASYPETTGYIIPTMLHMAEVLGDGDLAERAVRAGEWLLDIQDAKGGWQGGRVGEGRAPVVFNTAQVVRGMLALHRHTGEVRWRDAACRAAAWIASVQEADGSWARHNFLGRARVYDTYVDAPLLQVAGSFDMPELADAAHRNLAWVLGRQRKSGWFADADNTVRHNDRPITHTIAYTLDGLLECHALTRDEALLEAALRPAIALAGSFLAEGRLNGRYNERWEGSEAMIATGCAQMAIVWTRLSGITGDERPWLAATRMMELLLGMQELSAAGPHAAHGALTGSVPLWGRYEKFACPNWATKYLCDALLMHRAHAHVQAP